jgi:hypothetical protein
MPWAGLVFVTTLGLLHVYADRLRWKDWLPEHLWLSFGAGVSIAYVFVDILPILGAGQAVLAESSGAIVERIKHPVYLLALIGLVAFYSLELLAKRSRAENSETAHTDCTTPGVFWVHIAAFALYNALLGYLLRDAEHHGLLTCALLFFALMLHFMVNDYALRSHHKALYDRFGRWILALSVVGGYLIGSRYMVDEVSIAMLWAFVAGGLILNVIKDELPHHRQTSLASFLIGMGGYSFVLLMVAH